MTFHPAMRQVIESLDVKGKVCEMGNQRFTAGNDFPSTQAFYESRGLAYLALDVNERMGAKIWDLNTLGARDQYGTFDLVTNNGTSEHIFNQYTVFRNIHELSSNLMVHMLPFTPWINHGFYNYNPLFFADLALTNDYEILRAAICDRLGNFIELGSWGFQEYSSTFKKNPEMGSVLTDNQFCCFVFRKKEDEPFGIPFQGKYLKDRV